MLRNFVIETKSPIYREKAIRAIEKTMPINIVNAPKDKQIADKREAQKREIVV